MPVKSLLAQSTAYSRSTMHPEMLSGRYKAYVVGPVFYIMMILTTFSAIRHNPDYFLDKLLRLLDTSSTAYATDRAGHNGTRTSSKFLRFGFIYENQV